MQTTIQSIYLLVSLFTSGTLLGQNDSAQTQSYNPCEYGIETAIANAENGTYVRVTYGNTYYSDWSFQQFYELYLQETYGIIWMHVGCSISPEDLCLKTTMDELIFAKFGSDIYDKSKADAYKFYRADTQTKIDSNEIFSDLDTMPNFQGGTNRLQKYIRKYINCGKDLNGVLVAEVTIEKDGSVTDVKIEQGISTQCDQEVINVLQNSKNWQPGVYFGQAVRTRMKITIRFD